jgi:hypothetical protein
VTFTHADECRDPVCPQPHEIRLPSVAVEAHPARQAILTALIVERSVPPTREDEEWARGYQRGLAFALAAIDDAAYQERQRSPVVDREQLADAIFMHRLGQYQRSDALESSHLCFEDCAEDIAAHYGKPAR